MKKEVAKNNNIDNKKFLEIFLISIVLIIVIFLSLDLLSSNSHILKPEYNIGEKGTLDDIDITLKSVNYINKESGIEVTFDITNNQSNTITIKPDDYFKFYDLNKVQIPNKYENDKNIIKKKERLIYKLQYDVTEKSIYEIYFYSQVAENNIKFTFKSKDIELDKVTEGGSDKEVEKTIKDN